MVAVAGLGPGVPRVPRVGQARWDASPMSEIFRAAFAAALVLLLSAPTIAADKSFKRDDLADAATKLEAQIKAESGQVTKPIAELRREVDAAFQRGDDRGGARILGQIVAVAPNRSVT